MKDENITPLIDDDDVKSSKSDPPEKKQNKLRKGFQKKEDKKGNKKGGKKGDKKMFATFMEKRRQFWLPPQCYEVLQSVSDDEPKKVSSILTILSIWNTMIGSTTIAIPSCVYGAGIIPTIVLAIFYVLICFYTCRVVVKTGGKDNDYSDTVSRYFGKKFGYIGRVIQISFNLAINTGAIFIYFLIINENLTPCLALIVKLWDKDLNIDDVGIPTFKRFSIIYSSIIVGVLVFPLLIMKNMSPLVKINSYGIYLVSVLLVFVISVGIYSLCTTSFKFGYYKNVEDPTQPRYLYLFGPNVSQLAGTFTLGYFSHSFVLPVMKNNEKQENNKRDLLIGYILVCLTFIIIGIMGYIGFSGKNFSPEFKENWFEFFKADNYPIVVLRVLNVIQLLTILPVLCYIVRIQFFGTFFKSNYPGKGHVIIFSSTILLLSVIVLWFFYQKLGALISVIGSATGLFLIYIIPLVINIVYYRRKHPANLEELQQNQKVDEIISYTQERQTETTQTPTDTSEKKDIDDFGISQKPKNIIKDIFFYISQGTLIIIGLFTLVIQFCPINFFGIEIKERK